MDQTTIEEALKALRDELEIWLTPIQARIDQVSAKLDQAAAARWDVRILDTSDERVIDLVMRLLALRPQRSSLLATLPEPVLRSCIGSVLRTVTPLPEILASLHHTGYPVDQNTFYRFVGSVKRAYEHGLQVVLVGSPSDLASVRSSAKPRAKAARWGRSAAARIARRLATNGSCKLARTLPQEVLVETVSQLMLNQRQTSKVRRWLSDKIGQNVHGKQVGDLYNNVHAAMVDMERSRMKRG